MRHTTGAAELASVVSDLDRRGLLEGLDGRSRRPVEPYLRSLPELDGDPVEVISIDPYEASPGDPHGAATDAGRRRPLHLVPGENTALDSVRRERQREAGRRKPKVRGAAAGKRADARIPTAPAAGC